MEKAKSNHQTRYWWRSGKKEKANCAVRYRPGHLCPHCLQGALAYDGLFLLTCPTCGYVAEGGAFT